VGGGTAHGLSGGGGCVTFVGTGHGVSDVDHRPGETENGEVGAVELYTGFAADRFVVAVFVVAGGFVDEENAGGGRAGGGDGGTGVWAEGATIHIL
jgi:hypothetical protein